MSMHCLVVAIVSAALVLGTCPTAATDVETSPSGAFRFAGKLAEPRGLHVAVPQPDGTVLIVGGNGGRYTEGQTAAPTESWDPATNAFTTVGPAIAEPDDLMVPLADGHILVIGERGPEVRDPMTGEATPIDGLLTDRDGPAAVVLDDGRVLLIGGWRSGRLQRSAEVWDPVSDVSAWTGGLPRGLWPESFTTTLLADGRVLVVGGEDDKDRRRSEAFVWEAGSGEFRPAGKLGEGRARHTATLLPDGRVLVVGGLGQRRGGWGYGVLSAELWDPVTETFSPAGLMAEHRWDHTATLLPDGRVLIVGGSGGTYANTVFAWTSIWDPATQTFQESEVLDRTHHTATALPDGRVLVAGGMANDKWRPSAYLWDPDAVPSAKPDVPDAKAIRRELREWVSPQLRCQPYERSEVDNDPFAFGALEALICRPRRPADHPGVDYLTVFRFRDARSMEEYWRYRQALNPKMEWRRKACADGAKGYGIGPGPEYFCYRSKSSGRALIRWKDEGTNTYGVLDATDRDLRGLWDAWQELGPNYDRGVEVV